MGISPKIKTRWKGLCNTDGYHLTGMALMQICFLLLPRLLYIRENHVFILYIHVWK